MPTASLIRRLFALLCGLGAVAVFYLTWDIYGQSGEIVWLFIAVGGFLLVMARVLSQGSDITEPATAKPVSFVPHAFLLKAVGISVAAIVGLIAFTAWDQTTAEDRVEAICRAARPGQSLEPFLQGIKQDEFRILRGDDQVTLVPRQGMGRHHCVIHHAGARILSAEPGFVD